MVTNSTDDTAQPEKGRFSVEAKNGYIHLITRGKLDIDHLDDPANAAIDLAREKKIDKLLDDIRQVDSTGADIQVQSKGFGVLWKLRTFDKVAIVFGKEERLSKLFFSTIQTIHITSKFRGFDNEEDAVKWLKNDKDQSTDVKS